jgi:5-bromo-4-chloroindolyl phosphate hydrolysis protein
MVQEIGRKIELEIERNRIRINIFHGEDEQVIKLNLEEARELVNRLEKLIEDYSKRKQIRID